MAVRAIFERCFFVFDALLDAVTEANLHIQQAQSICARNGV